ncbi:DUF2243 domain-containing protein [Paracnuella aquatica]|uniref:DUF2243 domain-containing protein n=1 Tax=Paracnuella aquatica TaxID=2268757 RepID=UPI0019D46F25|nr:DUF2243 domain-containing protein [Paracnuella aquatica]
MKKLMLKPSICLPALLATTGTKACITCNRQVQQAIFDSAFYPNLALMLSPFFVLALIVAGLAVYFKKGHARRQGLAGRQVLANGVPLATAAFVLGIGLGGFADGIVLHQILQWHEMLSAKIPPDTLVNKSVNMFWDGIFHAFCLLVVLTGMVMLWRVGKRPDADRSGYLLAGGLLGGWGVFNIVEGILDHQVLKLHNVREVSSSPEAWNFGFLGFSVILLGVGWALMQKRI